MEADVSIDGASQGTGEVVIVDLALQVGQDALAITLVVAIECGDAGLPGRIPKQLLGLLSVQQVTDHHAPLVPVAVGVLDNVVGLHVPSPLLGSW